MTDELKRLTLGVISHKHHWVDPEGLKTTGGFGRQIEELSLYFGRTILIVPFSRQQFGSLGYTIQIKNLELVPLPTFSGAGARGKLDFLKKMPLISWRIWRSYARCDIMHYRIPGYVGVLALLLRKLRYPQKSFIWIGTDWPDRILQTHNTGSRRLVAAIAGRMLPWLIRDVPTFALGHLVREYDRTHPYVHSTVSTILSDDDLIEVAWTEFHCPIRLLFVGRLAEEKGIAYLVDAVALCKKKGLDIHLTIVGDGLEMRRLGHLTKAYCLEGCVHLKGFVPIGEDLWALYRESDIFVLPSLSEGQGKVLIEAMASGLLVIATEVGGIPTIIQHRVNGLLVKPRSPQAIADAIEWSVREPEACKEMVQNCITAAKRYTIEECTEQLVNQLSQDLESLGWR